LIAFAIAVAASLGAGHASANSSRTITGQFPIDQYHAVFEPESTVCGFPISAALTGRGTFQVLLDAEGNFVRGHVLFRISGTLTANGITIRFARSDNQFFELDGTVTEVGLVFRDLLPGLGVVLMDRGRLVFDGDGQLVFEAGPHPQLHGDYGGLCAALAP
jgi:hypothetical protein